jgi:hypothetical protein
VLDNYIPYACARRAGLIEPGGADRGGGHVAIP